MCLVPTFRMHVREQHDLVVDLEGVELENLHQAIEEATIGLRAMAADCLTAGHRFTVKSVVISNDAGAALVEVTAAEALAPVLSAALP